MPWCRLFGGMLLVKTTRSETARSTITRPRVVVQAATMLPTGAKSMLQERADGTGRGKTDKGRLEAGTRCFESS